MNPSEDRLADLEVENAALRAQVSELPILRAQITALPSRWLALPPLFLLRTPGQADLGRSGAVSRPSRGDAACGESSADWVASSAWSTRCATSPPVARSRRSRPSLPPSPSLQSDRHPEGRPCVVSPFVSVPSRSHAPRPHRRWPVMRSQWLAVGL